MYYEGRARSGELTINGYNRLRPVAYLVEAVCDAIIDAWNEYGDATG